MSIYGITEKVCASCMYWSGKRSVSFQYVDTNGYIGKCNCESSFSKINTLEASSCSDWKGVLHE